MSETKNHELILNLDDEKKHLENLKYSQQWSICCSHTDPEAFKYLVTLVIGILVIVFSMIQICRADEGHDTSIYFSMISTIVGVFLPSPRFTPPDHEDN